MHISVQKIIGSLFLLTLSVIVSAQKTDKLYLKNGDVITGEIRSMKFAMLNFNMNGPGVIQVKWAEIVKIVSTKKFQITMRLGQVYVRTLDSLFLEQRHATLDDVVEIVKIKDRFLQRMDGDINLGFNFAKSNSALQFNLGSSITYRVPRTELNFKLNSALSNNANDSMLTKKQDATINYYRRLKKSYYLNNVIGWQENTELGLDNRFLLSILGGKIFVNTNHRRLLSGAGISFNVEQSRGNPNYAGNVEGLVAFQFKEFYYSTPKISIDSRLAIFPGLSDLGRIRIDFQISSKFEIFKDFNIGLNLYDTYDSRPPEGAASSNDYGLNFTIGYIFGK